MILREIESFRGLENYGLALTFIDSKPFFRDEDETGKKLAIGYGLDFGGTGPRAVYAFEVVKIEADYRVELNLRTNVKLYDFESDELEIKAKVESLLESLNDALQKHVDYSLTGFREAFLTDTNYDPYIFVVRER